MGSGTYAGHATARFNPSTDRPFTPAVLRTPIHAPTLRRNACTCVLPSPQPADVYSWLSHSLVPAAFHNVAVGQTWPDGSGPFSMADATPLSTWDMVEEANIWSMPQGIMLKQVCGRRDQTAAMRLTTPCCAMLRHAAPCCAMLRHAAPCCALPGALCSALATPCSPPRPACATRLRRRAPFGDGALHPPETLLRAPL